MKIDKQYDIKRLEKIVTNLNKITDIVYHMDDSEYKRFRQYIDARFGISFPYTRPSAITTKEELLELDKTNGF